MTKWNYFFVALVVIGLFCPALNAAEPVPGDRNLSINQLYPPEAFYHNGKGGRVLDVTKSPFNAKGDGITDDTKALCAAMQFVRDHYERLQGEGYSYCEQKRNQNWVIYLPEGEYLVSDTISQGWPAKAIHILKGWSDVQSVQVKSPEHEIELNSGGKTRVYAEINWAIRIVGQNRQKTIIRLKDSAAGFGQGSEKAVVAFYLLQQGSNVNSGNVVENVTIDTGKGNQGAVGLLWNSSNWGGIHNIAIRSGDGGGSVGLMMDRRNATGYHHDISIDGFDIGIALTGGHETVVTLEYATLSHQHKTAIWVGNTEAKHGGGDCLSARKLLVSDAPVSLHANEAAQVVLLDSKLTSSQENAVALVVEPDSHLVARNVTLSGYRAAVLKHGEIALSGTYIEEYVSTEPVCLPKDSSTPLSHLSVKDWPLLLPEQDLSKWANVDAFGAVGDGVTDDTAAVQRAMNSGKPVVYFPKANYVINGTVDIPATVREITWWFGSVHRSMASKPDGPALFRVAEASTEPLRIHKATTAGGVFLDHQADRTVVLEDIAVYFQHVRDYAKGMNMLFPSPAAQNTDIWRLYRNTRPEEATKEIFVNDCSFFGADNLEGKHAIENVQAWARMVNNEHLPGAQFAFRRSNAWIFGFKSENGEQLFRVEDHSHLDVLGGSFLNWMPRKGPVIVSQDSSVSAVFFLWNSQAVAEIVFQSENKDAVTTLSASQFPKLGRVDGTVVVVGSNFH